MNRFYVFLLLGVCCWSVSAQKTGQQSQSMRLGESCIYDVYYKWGLIMSRAGEASFLYTQDQSVDNASARYQMLFKSTKFYDNFFKMRDTLMTYYDNNTIIYSKKHSDEGNYYSIDLMTFTKEGNQTHIHSLRYVPPRKRIDTILVATGEVADLLGVLFHTRGINRKMLQSGDVFPLTVAIGRDLVKTNFIYQNQSIVERENVKYNTLYFKIDIYDEAFESTKTSAEVWIGDDDNMLPIKLRSKMKIGYVEVYYRSSSLLAHPLTCGVTIK